MRNWDKEKQINIRCKTGLIPLVDLEIVDNMGNSVSEAAAVGVPDEKWGERPVAFVVLRDEFKGRELELKDELK